VNWNRDISQAPKGEYVDVPRVKVDKHGKDETYFIREYHAPRLWVSYDGDQTGMTKWLPPHEDKKDKVNRRPVGRWEGFKAGEEPEAFIVLPGHVDAEAA